MLFAAESSLVRAFQNLHLLPPGSGSPRVEDQHARSRTLLLRPDTAGTIHRVAVFNNRAILEDVERRIEKEVVGSHPV